MALQAGLAGVYLSEYGFHATDSVCIVGIGFGRDLIFVNDQLVHLGKVLPRVVGLDINLPRLVETKQKLKEEGITADLLVGSMNTIPVPADTFLATICLDTLVHADDLKQSLLELKRVTRPNGLIICNLPTSHTLPVDLLKSVIVEGLPRTMSLALERLISPNGFSARTTYYLPRQIDKVISSCDLEIVERKSFAYGMYTFLVIQK